MTTFTLTELQYAETGYGPWRIYCYDSQGYYTRAPWFRKGPMKYPDEEIQLTTAKRICDENVNLGFEVRITDGGDELVFHSKGGKILYGENFWSEVM